MASQITRIKPNIPLYVERCTVTTSVPDVVIIFGWTNCKLRYLSKVASFWRKKGCYHILYYAAPHFPYIYFPYKSANVCENFIPFLHEWGTFNSEAVESETTSIVADFAKPQHRPKVIAHVFSNGGGGGFAGFIQSLKAHNLSFRFSAIILDSLPGMGKFYQLHRLFTASQTNPFKKFMTMIIAAFLMSITFPLTALYLVIIRKKPIIEYILHALMYEQAAKCPRLFVYSKKDELIPYKAIEKAVRMSIDVGHPTEKMMFEDTDHVKHWADRQEVYETTVDNFLKKYEVVE